ncbi:MAG: hypothetical protein KAR00_00635 [Candidatus Pacebacteria bacterium]|nr:hypothetical protein [Candidatus Paceibacterota bacterium]
MAEEKKPTIAKDPVVSAIDVGAGLLLVIVLADALRRILKSIISKVNPNFLSRTYWVEMFIDMSPVLKIVSVTLSVIFLVGIFYLTRKINMIRAEEIALLYPKGRGESAATDTESQKVENKKWEKVLARVESSNPSDWKVAILEADIMLEEILEKMGYHGDTMSDRLKQVEKSDFTTIDLAWEAHKIRNAIAHEGGDFLLNERETRRVIDLYRQVFEEFYYI